MYDEKGKKEKRKEKGKSGKSEEMPTQGRATRRLIRDVGIFGVQQGSNPRGTDFDSV